jgi:hypothetical protein
MAGGVGNRLGCLNIPKALAPIPVSNSMEPILSRTLRLLGNENVILCLGWEAQLFNERWPNQERITTYDINNPTGAGMCLKTILQSYDANRYTIFLGDVVWSKSAMREWMGHRQDKDIVFYHDHHRSYSETFAISISFGVRSILLEMFDVKEIPALTGEKNKYKTQMTLFKDARLGGIEKLVDNNKKVSGRKVRICQAYAADDIDTDEQYFIITKNLIGGLYEH